MYTKDNCKGVVKKEIDLLYSEIDSVYIAFQGLSALINKNPDSSSLYITPHNSFSEFSFDWNQLEEY